MGVGVHRTAESSGSQWSVGLSVAVVEESSESRESKVTSIGERAVGCERYVAGDSTSLADRGGTAGIGASGYAHRVTKHHGLHGYRGVSRSSDQIEFSAERAKGHSEA